MDTHSSHESGKEKKEVTVTVDKKKKEVRSGEYTVSAFKEAVKVDADKVLEQLINGTFTPLEDTATIVIHGDEIFASHVRRGGSSWK